MATIHIEQAQVSLSELMERAHAGEEVIIAKLGHPYVRIIAVDPRPKRRPGLLQGEVGEAFFEPLPADELAAWER